MPDIVVTEFMEDSALAELSREYSVVHDAEMHARPDDIKLLAADAPALIVRNMTKLRGELLAACKGLRVIGALDPALDNIDLDACKARGIKIAAARGANAPSVAEYVMAAMLRRRDVWNVTEKITTGWWDRPAMTFTELQGKWLGLIGFGAVAREVARRARAFGMRIGAYDPNMLPGDPVWTELGVTHLDLVPLLSQSDVVSIHAALTPGTRRMIGPSALALMKKDALLINSARGGIVDEAALAEALRAGRIGGAVLDVLEIEPPGRDFVLRGAPNLVLTPHIAGLTVEANIRASALVAAAVRRVLQAPPG